MDFLQIITIALHIMHVVTKSRKHHETTSEEESIENLLYFKDCQRKPKETPSPVVHLARPPPTEPPKNDCPFPKMCCAMTCGNECGGGNNLPFMNRPMEPVSPVLRQGNAPFHHMMQPISNPNMLPLQSQLRKRKKIQFPHLGQGPLPMNTRRNFGFTKEKIKSLISQDNDIKTILKDLVRVTMQKVNLEGDQPQNYNYGYENEMLSSSTTPANEEYDEITD